MGLGPTPSALRTVTAARGSVSTYRDSTRETSDNPARVHNRTCGSCLAQKRRGSMNKRRGEVENGRGGETATARFAPFSPSPLLPFFSALAMGAASGQQPASPVMHPSGPRGRDRKRGPSTRPLPPLRLPRLPRSAPRGAVLVFAAGPDRMPALKPGSTGGLVAPDGSVCIVAKGDPS